MSYRVSRTQWAFAQIVSRLFRVGLAIRSLRGLTPVARECRQRMPSLSRGLLLLVGAVSGGAIKFRSGHQRTTPSHARAQPMTGARHPLVRAISSKTGGRGDDAGASSRSTDSQRRAHLGGPAHTPTGCVRASERTPGRPGRSRDAAGTQPGRPPSDKDSEQAGACWRDTCASQSAASRHIIVSDNAIASCVARR
jgi:hypothetical protein